MFESSTASYGSREILLLVLWLIVTPHFEGLETSTTEQKLSRKRKSCQRRRRDKDRTDDVLTQIACSSAFR